MPCTKPFRTGRTTIGTVLIFQSERSNRTSNRRLQFDRVRTVVGCFGFSCIFFTKKIIDSIGSPESRTVIFQINRKSSYSQDDGIAKTMPDSIPIRSRYILRLGNTHPMNLRLIKKCWLKTTPRALLQFFLTSVVMQNCKHDHQFDDDQYRKQLRKKITCYLNLHRILFISYFFWKNNR